MLLFGVGALVFVFGMGAQVGDFHLSLPIDSQGFCTYATYYLMLLVLLFGVHAPMLIFGMGTLMLPYHSYFCILFLLSVLLFGQGTLMLIVEKPHMCLLSKQRTGGYCRKSALEHIGALLVLVH